MACEVCILLIIQAVKMTDDLIKDRCHVCGELWDNAGTPRWPDEPKIKKFASKIPGVPIEGFLDTTEKVSKLHEKFIEATEECFHELEEAGRNSFFAAREIILD